MCSRTNGSSHYQVTNKANNEKSALFSEDGKIEKKKQPKSKEGLQSKSFKPNQTT